MTKHIIFAVFTMCLFVPATSFAAQCLGTDCDGVPAVNSGTACAGEATKFCYTNSEGAKSGAYVCTSCPNGTNRTQVTEDMGACSFRYYTCLAPAGASFTDNKGSGTYTRECEP